MEEDEDAEREEEDDVGDVVQAEDDGVWSGEQALQVSVRISWDKKGVIWGQGGVDHHV